MRRRGFLLGLLLAAPAGAAQAAIGDTSGLSAAPDLGLEVEEAQYGYGPPPGWRGRRRRPRCRIVRRQVAIVDRFGRVRGYRWVTREVCR